MHHQKQRDDMAACGYNSSRLRGHKKKETTFNFNKKQSEAVTRSVEPGRDLEMDLEDIEPDISPTGSKDGNISAIG